MNRITYPLLQKLLIAIAFIAQTHNAFAQNHRDLFEVKAAGGYAMRLLKPEPTPFQLINDHNDKLRRGFYLDGGLQYNFNEHIGIGLFVDYFRTENRSPDAQWIVDFNGSIQTLQGYLEDRFHVLTYSMRMYFKLIDERKFKATLGLGAGYTNYFHDGFLVIEAFKITGNTLGGDAVLDVRYEFESNLYLGFHGMLQSAYVNLDENNLEHNGIFAIPVTDTDISRFGVGLSLTYSFGSSGEPRKKEVTPPKPERKKEPRRFR